MEDTPRINKKAYLWVLMFIFSPMIWLVANPITITSPLSDEKRDAVHYLTLFSSVIICIIYHKYVLQKFIGWIKRHNMYYFFAFWIISMLIFYVATLWLADSMFYINKPPVGLFFSPNYEKVTLSLSITTMVNSYVFYFLLSNEREIKIDNESIHQDKKLPKKNIGGLVADILMLVVIFGVIIIGAIVSGSSIITSAIVAILTSAILLALAARHNKNALGPLSMIAGIISSIQNMRGLSTRDNNENRSSEK